MSTRSIPVWSAVLIAVLCGVGIAVQSRINGELGARLDDGFTAAAISFGSGLVILSVVLAFSPAGRAGLGRIVSALRDRELAWWYLCGGAAGAFLVLSQGVAVSALGVALFTVGTVAGQSVSGLVLDRVGLGAGGKRALTPARVGGAVLALAAVLWSVSGQLGGSAPILLMIMPLVAGLGMGWQQAVNGQVRVTAGSALTATFNNFLVGTVVLVVLMLIDWAVAGMPEPLPSEPWLYIGGALGCLFIAGATLLVRITGVLVLSLSTVAGQLVAALVMDVLFPAGAEGIGVQVVAGTLLALVAVVIAGVDWSGIRHRVRS